MAEVLKERVKIGFFHGDWRIQTRSDIGWAANWMNVVGTGAFLTEGEAEARLIRLKEEWGQEFIARTARTFRVIAV